MKQAVYKARGGLIRISLKGSDKIESIAITGDFFFFPEDAIERLERYLVGKPLEKNILQEVIESFYRENEVDAPGLEPREIAEAITRAL